MSIYSYLGCVLCKEKLWVADPDTSSFHPDSDQILRFLEKHRKHSLSYDWEDGVLDGFKGFEQ